MKKFKSSPTHPSEFRGLCSVSDFINEMPSKLSWSENASIAHLKLFCSPDHHVQVYKGLEETVEKIKSAVKGLGVFLWPTLVQIWAPKSVGGQQFLACSNLPFGINSLVQGLCLYRKECLNCKYSLDGEEELGPVGRVFRNGFPEFSPYVSFYSDGEFKLKDYAESYGLCGYLALPVFEGEEKNCSCVLELITIFDGDHCLKNTMEHVSKALQTVGLRTYDICSFMDMEGSSNHETALSEIEKDLKVVCDAHSIPFAQTWFACKGEKSAETVMCTREKGSSLLHKRVSSFQKDCIKFCLKEGKGVVWRAFTSRNSWFCKDISQLSIDEFPLVLSARKAGLIASFAICLKSLLDENDIYVLEFFLPSKQTSSSKPSTYFMNSLLTTVLQHFKRFKVAVKQDQGMDGTVCIINCITDDGNATTKKNDNATAPNKSTMNTSDIMVLKISSRKECENTEFVIDANTSTEKQLPAKNDSDPQSKKRKADHSLTQHNRESKMDDADSSENIMIIKAKYKDDMIKFPLPFHSGLLRMKGEVIKRLKLKEDGFKIKYPLENHEQQIPVESDSDLQNIMNTARSQGSQTLRFLLEPVQSESKIIVKLTYEDDMIKFPFSPSAGVMDLKNEVTTRFKVSGESFRVKYQDAAGEWIYISNDEQLQNYLSVMDSNKTAVRFHCELIKN